MPGKNGYDFLLELKKDKRFKKIPVIMLSTESEKDKIMDAIASGDNNYLIKPFDSAAFSEKIIAVWNKVKKGA